MQTVITYDNKPSNASLVGWANLPEYCVGNPETAAKVTHDHRQGIFVFHDDEEHDISILLQAYRL